MKMEYEKILFSRLILAFFWTVILHILPLSFYVIVTNFDVVHPIQWLVTSTYFIFNFGTWFSLIPSFALTFGLGYVLSKELKKPPCLATSRFNFLCGLVTRTNILKLVLHFALGIILPWTYLRINNMALTQYCAESGQLCMNRHSVFLVSCGVWTAMYYFGRDVVMEKHLLFPIIRQLRFLQIRSRFPSVFWNCFKLTLIPVFYFLVFYFWYGRQVENLFDFFLIAPVEPSSLFTVPTLIRAWLISSVYFTLVETLQLMVQIHFTEHYSFQLMKQPNSASVLSCALVEQRPIIQYLACYDLYIISTSNKFIRGQVFTLSQPGGHPHTWNAILHESLRLIDKFICEVQEIYKVPEPVKTEPPIPKHYHMRDMTMRHEQLTSGPVPLSPNSRIRHLVTLNMKSPTQQGQKSEFWKKMDEYAAIIQQNSVVNYIFGSKPDAKVRFLVSNSQPLIWVIQSIAELSANALMEDQFGIVLKDLPVIINTLLRLKFSLDKMGNLQKKFQKQDFDLCMKASLKSALRRSLYRIAIAYSEYLNDLPLPTENLKCMESFVNFKEC